jgi:hypothetical protein
MTNVNVGEIASTAEKVLESVMKFEPTVATMAGMFVPGAAPVVAMVQPELLILAPFVENALKAIAVGKGGNIADAFIELIQHITPGHPNSPSLNGLRPASATVPDMPPPPSA